MNLIDLAIVAIFVFFMLAGLYRGFLSTLLSIASFLVAWLLAFAFLSVGSNIVKDNEKFYTTMLYYTEGSEYIADVEKSRLPIASIRSTELAEIIDEGDLPYPMGKQITKNIAREAFASEGVTTLGEYFNETIVRVFINIFSFLVLFAVIRLVIAFIVNGVDYAWRLPVLRAGDAPLAAGLGLVRGILAAFLIFVAAPMLLVVLGGKMPAITNMVNDSLFSAFFYRSNFILSMMPGV